MFPGGVLRKMILTQASAGRKFMGSLGIQVCWGVGRGRKRDRAGEEAGPWSKGGLGWPHRALGNWGASLGAEGPAWLQCRHLLPPLWGPPEEGGRALQRGALCS